MGEKAYLAQSTVMYGLPWGGDGICWSSGAEHYRAGALGLGLSLGNFGAMSLDTIYSRGQQRDMIMKQDKLGVFVTTSPLD